MKVVAIIPARFGSTRFPGKPLAMILGKPMVQLVYENALKCRIIDRVVVATENEDIARTVKGFGGEVCKTSPNHVTGTDRVAEVAKELDAQIIINVQGDEPLLPSGAIEEAALPLLNDNTIKMGTLKTKIQKKEDIFNPNIVKVVTNSEDFALYFSRLPIPYVKSKCDDIMFFRHIGLYVYNKDFLLKFSHLPQSPLERAESLEQLRALEHGYPIKVKETNYYPLGVDVPEDIALVEKELRLELNLI
jgi:3-deoxy-manno-octulosonate cytidylyltransferase (CMP-KDO synthetase)